MDIQQRGIDVHSGNDCTLHGSVLLLRDVPDQAGLSFVEMHDQLLENGGSLASFAYLPMGEVPSDSIGGLHSAHLGHLPVQSQRA